MEWINIKDRLPELVDNKYLVFVQGDHERKRIKICKWVGIKSHGRCVYKWLSSAFPANHVTHWMPLPEMPQTTKGSED